MSVVHLATRDDWTLCQSSAARFVVAGSAHDVTCKRCSRRLETLNYEGWDEVLERRREMRTRAAAEAVGLDPVLDFLSTQGDTAYVHMVSGIIGSLAVYLHESGYTRPETSAAA